ncbi:facilitated trehalose transporter Tret1-like [Leguminivora glycinivorella]|uniref:facilitated trehalose transporter Tret1-like n=1 Tax=Leguminivora glycinivorella TaxID=1035111 RepID=UPI00200ED66F|nr:facilitated trehalose transporter Tret1-like [Leguminivora glycinivorella]
MFSPEIKQSWAVSGILLNMLAQGMILSFSAVLLSGLKADDSTIKTDLETMSWLASVVGMACFPGFLISALLMELLGRKISQILVILPAMLGWLLIYFAKDVTTLMVGRFLGGFTAGASLTLGAVIIGEYTSPQLRGMFLNLKTAGVCVGNSLVHVLGHFYTWRTIAMFGLIPYIISFGIICTWPESPTWLAARFNFNRSEKAWLWLRGNDQNSRIEYENMANAQKQRFSETREKTSVQKHVVIFLQKFTRKDFLKPLFIILIGAILLEACGRHIFPAYALEIIEEITGDKTKTLYYTLIIDLITSLSATFSSALVRMLKRRILLFVTGGASLVILIAICTYLYLTDIDVISKDRAWMPLSMFMLYFLLANLGCTPIPLALLGEVFPVAHRGAGSAISGLILATCLMVGLKITPAMLATFKVYGTFAIFGVVLGFSLIVIYFILPETKDRTLQEIEDYFNHGRFSDKKVCGNDEENTTMFKD